MTVEVTKHASYAVLTAAQDGDQGVSKMAAYAVLAAAQDGDQGVSKVVAYAVLAPESYFAPEPSGGQAATGRSMLIEVGRLL